jgi:transcriptional regulator with XRE-family HTH domain
MHGTRSEPRDGPGVNSEMRRQQLAGFLTSRRHMLSPPDVGLAGAGRRRTPGLRREEVAQLSGVSITWYTWLEQARDITVSSQVLDSLARALRLTAAERRHLFTLAGAALPVEPMPRPSVSPTLRALVDTLDPNPAHLVDPYGDLLAYNHAYEALVGGLEHLPDRERNSIRLLFTRPSMRTLLVDWHREATEALAQLRAAIARFPDQPRADALIRALTAASPAFVAMWSAHPVQASAPTRKQFQHAGAGRVEFDYAKLSVGDDQHQHLVVFLPATPEDALGLHRIAGLPGEI